MSLGEFAAVYYKLLRKGYVDGDISEINGAGKCFLKLQITITNLTFEKLVS